MSDKKVSKREEKMYYFVIELRANSDFLFTFSKNKKCNCLFVHISELNQVSQRVLWWNVGKKEDEDEGPTVSAAELISQTKSSLTSQMQACTCTYSPLDPSFLNR